MRASTDATTLAHALMSGSRQSVPPSRKYRIERAGRPMRSLFYSPLNELGIHGERVVPTFIDRGAPEEIRTPDPQIRSLVLYPAELRALLPDPDRRSRSRRTGNS
jgi:hypothetical protein